MGDHSGAASARLPHPANSDQIMPANTPALSPAQIEGFIADGFVRLDNAFPRTLADECRSILWTRTGCNPDDPSTWTRPVIRLDYQGAPPFRAAANTPTLHA